MMMTAKAYAESSRQPGTRRDGSRGRQRRLLREPGSRDPVVVPTWSHDDQSPAPLHAGRHIPHGEIPGRRTVSPRQRDLD
jgi:hypothetical protein